MLILGADFETTGLDPERNAITEVGMVLWETETKTPVRVMGYLVNPPETAEWDPEVLKISHITPEDCTKYGYPDERGLRQFLLWLELADMVCAHNGRAFDRKFLRAWAKRYGYDWHPNKLWIDTNSDIELPLPNKMSRKLTYMASDHGFLNPFPHRAVFDVMTMFKVLAHYDLERVIFLAKQPDILIQALVSFDDKELAKERGYRWQKETKQWTMPIKECFLEKEKTDAPFKIRVLGPVDPDQ